MSKRDATEKLSLVGALVIAVVYFHNENQELKKQVRSLRMEHDAFVQMVIERYHLPLAK